MPYTLMKALLWLVLALLIGFSVGWLLRSLVAHRQVARARSQRVDTAEVERLRGRVANLETVVAERDRLAAELAAARGSPPGEPPVASVTGVGLVSDTETGARDAVVPDRVTAVVPSADAGTNGAAVTPSAPGTDDTGSLPAAPSTDAAADVLGHPIELDDLKVVEGIGPKIEELCHGIGIRTWHDLASTEVSLLRTMLTDAGARYKMHDPSTWPQQAELLAHGRWAEFAELSAELDRRKAARS